MPSLSPDEQVFDLLIVGGGINGCGIARDAAGRGMSVVLAEMNDLAAATSSASTKLFHGGLRYLEYFEVNLVRHALAEREILLKAMPHISWPMRFVLPYHKDMRFEGGTPTSRLLNRIMPWMKGRRPSWLIRFGLFLYDHLGGRKILPATSTLDLRCAPEGEPLKDKFEKAYEYSDCWVEDSRLVVLNARDAADRGAEILVRTKFIAANCGGDYWEAFLEDVDTGVRRVVHSRMIVNAGGPWVGDVLNEKLGLVSADGVRLVRGSHIVTKRLFSHDKCYFFQGVDGRIIFAIPYEQDFTLIGTTDADHDGADTAPVCSDAEKEYLIKFINQYIKDSISCDDIVWSYSGVRPLYDDGASSASAATRDYILRVDTSVGAPVLNVFGGKITTYRKLAEDVMDKVLPLIGGKSAHWTAGVSLPGGDFDVAGVPDLVTRLVGKYHFLSNSWAKRLVRAYGTESFDVLGDAQSEDALGLRFGATLTEREVVWLMDREFARTAEDVVWRRSKLGLRMNSMQVAALDDWMKDRRGFKKVAS